VIYVVTDGMFYSYGIPAEGGECRLLKSESMLNLDDEWKVRFWLIVELGSDNSKNSLWVYCYCPVL
jgi:hypothetical protein